MKTGNKIKLTRQIRSHKGILPMEGTYVTQVQSLGRTLVLVKFEEPHGEQYIFPEEIEIGETNGSNNG